MDKYYNSANENGIKLGNANEASVDENKSHSFLFKTLGDASGIRLGIIQQSRVKNDIEVLSIKNDNVGIGTTNPDMKLSVKGQIHAEEVKIDLSVPAPDYVFKKDYDLKSIEEVEKFILKNSHLPEIPSAKDFEQNGVFLAQMDMNLLKK
nr:tail fiber protein [Aquimarina longa]